MLKWCVTAEQTKHLTFAKKCEEKIASFISDADDDLTKQIKECVVQVFTAAGVADTGFTKDACAKYMLGIAQAGGMPGPIGELSSLPMDEVHTSTRHN